MTWNLQEEVERFREWAGSDEPKYGEWETEYPHWDRLYATVGELLCSGSWPISSLPLLLYVLARDNEAEYVLDLLSQYQESGMALAGACINYPDSDARWQIAVFLGKVRTPEAIEMLKKLAEDENEYVRRRALIAIKDVDPEYAKAHAHTVDVDIFCGDGV